MFTKGEYQGKPTLIFKSDEADRYPFSFGKGKAIKLVKALAEEGTHTIVDALIELCGNDVTPDEIEKIKTELK